MNRISKLIAISCFIAVKTLAQSHWYPEGNAFLSTGIDTVVAAFYNDSVNNRLYVGGRFDEIGNVPANHIAYWDGVSWNALGNGIDTSGIVGIGSICSYNNLVYAAGTFRSFNDTVYNNIACWNGSTWNTVGGGLHGGSAPTVTDMCVYNGMLYVVGRFDSAGTIPAGGVAAWDGTNWHPINNSTTSLFWVWGCTVYDSTLILGGNFNYVDTGTGTVPSPKIVGWNAYTNQFELFPAIGGNVLEVRVFHNELYAGGEFQGSMGNHISRWDGLTWQPVGAGFDDDVTTMCIHHDSLIAGGNFRHSGSLTVNYIAMWNGSNWCNLDSGFNSPFQFSPMVLGCESFGNRLYAGGFFSYASSTRCLRLAVWPTSPLSVAGPSQSPQPFKCAPNPFMDEFTISFSVTSEPAEIRFIDLSGHVCGVRYIDMPGDYVMTFSASQSGLSAGVYIFELRCGDIRQTQRVICGRPKE